jgi:hypothetical protein
MKAFVWLSFDLGVRGDFEGMYQFLDSHAAKECGDNLGAFSFEYKKDLIAELTKDLKAAVTFDKRSRVYVVFPSAQGKLSGRFLIGKRKSPAWTGYGSSVVDEDDTGE